MSVRIMTRIWDAAFPTLPMKLVALKLADCANDDGENIYPSVGRVERDTGASASVVREALADMEAAGLLVVVDDKFGNKRGRSTTVRCFDLERLGLLVDEWLVWRRVDVPVHDLKTGVQKLDDDGQPKTRLAWRLAQATPPAGGEVRQNVPIRVADPTPPGGGGVPLRVADPTPPGGGGAIEEPSSEPSVEPSLTHPARGARASGGRAVEWIEELRAEGHSPAVLDELLGRLLAAGLAAWKDGDPVGIGRQICLDLKADTVPVLEALREAILDRQKFRIPPVAEIRSLAATARAAAEQRLRERSAVSDLAPVAVLGPETTRLLEAIQALRPSAGFQAAWHQPIGVVAVDGNRVRVVTPNRPSLVEMHGSSFMRAAARRIWGAAIEVEFVQGRAEIRANTGAAA